MSFFVKAQHTGVDYDLAPPAARHNRDSDTASVTGGVTFNATADLTGEIEAGWSKRTFDDTAFADVSDLALSANLDWTPAKGTDVTFNASRSLEEEVLTGSSIYVATVIGIEITHHVSDRWALGATSPANGTTTRASTARTTSPPSAPRRRSRSAIGWKPSSPTTSPPRTPRARGARRAMTMAWCRWV
uniref:Outer membrane beta-barrel protein n=1 Tax=Phenylobacterium glaciei TaxID=2803784 RepID=A0A974S8F4_9CAUL|nr:outer membrane beta-barrel protein [Phenylobacterium glaciei]